MFREKATLGSFRPRPIDLSKAIPVIHKEIDDAEVHRSVPSFPSGMEPEEEEEAHIASAIAASLDMTSENKQIVDIPIPIVNLVEDYDQFDDPLPFTQGTHPIFYPDQTQEEIDMKIEYDMDTEDESWLQSHNKTLTDRSLFLNEDNFELIVDRCEKEAEYRPKEPLTIQKLGSLCKGIRSNSLAAVLTYWQGKRERRKNSSQIRRFLKPPAHDDPSPYVAFRPRGREKKLKTYRKNDQPSLLRMKKLRLEVERGRTLLEMVKKREKMKQDYIQVISQTFSNIIEELEKSGPLLEAPIAPILPFVEDDNESIFTTEEPVKKEREKKAPNFNRHHHFFSEPVVIVPGRAMQQSYAHYTLPSDSILPIPYSALIPLLPRRD
eukprot:TRINITY_DN1670_c0_g1_i1.p1 TRINITY_DN1670_c0_g1~~TRINITY_DN1670_c0_g1_i1.p1  ORF type:complete len:379 (+),score=85.53 TRINITY_DN1670_c0_g1_i1:236-1372(+)